MPSYWRGYGTVINQLWSFYQPRREELSCLNQPMREEQGIGDRVYLHFTLMY